MNRVAAGFAFALGIAVWVLCGALTGKREAWDDPAWFMYGLPALFVALVVLGYACPRNASLYGPLAMGGQARRLELPAPLLRLPQRTL